MTLQTGLPRRFLVRLDGCHVLLLVAVKAELRGSLRQQLRFSRLVWLVATSTIIDRIMLKFCFAERLLDVLMAFETQLPARLAEEFFGV